ncbi:hypothetical protein RB195_026316 [Necator americanus]|uniref:Uncharacterized protein n=1 Tax=Necator americanus TaxID=51031 RepID=A0ABR1EYL9_NECAM
MTPTLCFHQRSCSCCNVSIHTDFVAVIFDELYTTRYIVDSFINRTEAYVDVASNATTCLSATFSEPTHGGV